MKVLMHALAARELRGASCENSGNPPSGSVITVNIHLDFVSVNIRQ
jgi:hypothetical protein